MPTKEQIKALEAVITRTFLSANIGPVTNLVQQFGQEMNARLPHLYRYYLKGGNAISLLQNVAMTGDFDFQIMPPLDAYDDWRAAFAQFDPIILVAMKEALEVIPGAGAFDIQVFDVDELARLSEDIPELGRGAFEGVRQVKRRDMMMRIGSRYSQHLQRLDDTYGDRTYLDIVHDPGFENGRLELPPDYIAVTDIQPQKGPMIYINYTIPGFLLYRMVYSFQYEKILPDGAVEKFSLKSEIIDVSVPRSGSAEIYMSQDGVITHFRFPANPAYKFLIPGWGYHFYENVNLLQEIFLRVSGSVHKRQKRVDRGIIAMNELTRGMPGLLRGMTVAEPLDTAHNAAVLAFFGALMHNVDDLSQFHRGRSIYAPEMIAALRDILLREESERFQTAIARRVDADALDYYVKFRLDTHFDPALKTVVRVKDGFVQFKLDYNKTQYNDVSRLNEDTYQFITPYEEIVGQAAFPMDYAVINVTTPAFQPLLKFCDSPRYVGHVKDKNANAFLVTIHNKCVFYLIVQDCGHVLPEPDNHLTELLQLSILESQRYGLAKRFERRP